MECQARLGPKQAMGKVRAPPSLPSTRLGSALGARTSLFFFLFGQPSFLKMLMNFFHQFRSFCINKMAQSEHKRFVLLQNTLLFVFLPPTSHFEPIYTNLYTLIPQQKQVTIANVCREMG